MNLMIDKIDKTKVECLKQTQFKSRRCIWEVDNTLHCSVCGTCLDIKDQRDILKKLKIDQKNLTDYEIHGIVVQSCFSKNKLSLRLDKFLNQKYHYELAHFAEYEERDFVKVWQEHLKSGNICGLYWVAVTHRGISSDTLYTMFCEVHMLSHLNGGNIRKERAAYKRSTDFSSELSAKLKAEKKNSRSLSLQLKAAQEKCSQLEIKLFAHQTKLEKLIEIENSQEQIGELESRNQELERQNQELQQKLDLSCNESQDYLNLVEGLRQEKDLLLEQLSAQEEINRQLYLETDEILGQFNCDIAPCGKTAEEQKLCAKRVLVIGGLIKLKGYYKDMVEKQGGTFDYHDGYLHAGEKGLEERIKRSDIILCPSDFNSHGACYSVKKICKKLNKPYQILPSSSLNCISQALIESE